MPVRQSGSRPRDSLQSPSDHYWHACDPVKVILKPGISGSITIIMLVVTVNDGVWCRYGYCEGPIPSRSLAWSSKRQIKSRHKSKQTWKSHANTLLDAACCDCCFIISSDLDRGNCLLLCGLLPTEQDLRHIHCSHFELLTPVQRYVINATEKNMDLCSETRPVHLIKC